MPHGIHRADARGATRGYVRGNEAIDRPDHCGRALLFFFAKPVPGKSALRNLSGDGRRGFAPFVRALPAAERFHFRTLRNDTTAERRGADGTDDGERQHGFIRMKQD